MIESEPKAKQYIGTLLVYNKKKQNAGMVVGLLTIENNCIILYSENDLLEVGEITPMQEEWDIYNGSILISNK